MLLSGFFFFLICNLICNFFLNLIYPFYSHSLPRQNEWVTCIGEALITSLQPNASKQLRNLSALFAELLFLCILVSSPKSVVGVAPTNPKHHSQKHAGIEWLFLELAEVFFLFNFIYIFFNLFNFI